MSADSQLQFLVEHIREEISALRQDLNVEFKRHDTVIEKFMDDTSSRMALMEERILAIQKFMWMSLGITAFVVVIAEIVANVGQPHV